VSRAGFRGRFRVHRRVCHSRRGGTSPAASCSRSSAEAEGYAVRLVRRRGTVAPADLTAPRRRHHALAWLRYGTLSVESRRPPR
jgi:hypothetical protein